MNVSTYKIHASGTCPTGDRSEVMLRHHRLVIDEPRERGGTDQGGSPLETLMAALIGCTNVISHRIATEMGIRLELVSVEVTALLDGRVLKGERAEAVFPEIRLDVRARTDATAPQLQALRGALRRRCPVSVMLSDSGSRIRDDWSVVGAPQAREASGREAG